MILSESQGLAHYGIERASSFMLGFGCCQGISNAGHVLAASFGLPGQKLEAGLAVRPLQQSIQAVEGTLGLGMQGKGWRSMAAGTNLHREP